MNQTNHLLTGIPAASTLDAVQARFGRHIAARLTERAAQVGPDIGERLRFAREKALERARECRHVEAAPATRSARVGATLGGAALLGGRGPSGWWLKAASVMPAFALAAGLFLIQRSQDNAQISTAAEVDAALLADDLPPQAYSDAGFAEFLKSSSSNE